MVTERPPRLAAAAIQGVFWRYAARYSGKLLVFLSTVVLARLLSQEDFGVVAFAVTTIAFLDVFSDLGLEPALIYHRDDPAAANAAFWLGLALSLVWFGLAWVAAPGVGVWFQDPRAVPVTRVLALTFPLNALRSVHVALLRKHLQFGRKFVPDVLQALAKGLVSVACAFAGWGAWSLIIGQLAGLAVAVAACWVVVPWRPALRVARDRVRPLLAYGVKYLSLDLTALLLMNVDYILVGRYLGAALLGVYTLAFRIPELIILQLGDAVSGVLFPVYAQVRDDSRRLGQAFLDSVRYLALLTVPLGLGLALVARPLVLTLFSEKWQAAVEPLQAIALYALMLSLPYTAGSVYKAQNQVLVLTRLALLRAAVLVPALLWAVLGARSIVAVAWVQCAVAALSALLSLVVALRLLHLPLRGLVQALGPAALGGGLMAAAVAGALALVPHWPSPAQLALAVAVGALTYGAAQWWLQRPMLLQAGRQVRAALTRA